LSVNAFTATMVEADSSSSRSSGMLQGYPERRPHR
jgi:hypothetical protein